MKHVQKMLVFVMTMGALLALSSTSFAQDVVKLKPANHKLLLNDADVRVYEATYKPGDKMPMHSHPKHIVYILSGGKITFTDKAGKKEERTMKTGDVIANPPVTHMTENTGTTEVKVLVMELKHSMGARITPRNKIMNKKNM